MRRKEINLIRRAIKERWPIKQSLRPKLAKELEEALLQNDDVRSKIAAARALLEADKLNMEQEKRDQAIPDRVEVSGPNGRPIEQIVFYIPSNGRDENPPTAGTTGDIPS